MRSAGPRRLGGLCTVVLVAAVLVGAAQRDPLPAPGATVRSPASATAWLPDPHREAGPLVLADSELDRPLTTVDVRVSVQDATPIVQAGDSAVVAQHGRVVVVSGRTWSVSAVTVPSYVEIVAGPTAAWLLPPGAQDRHALRRLDLRSAPARLGAPIPTDAAVTPASARVDREGRLWVLRPDRLEVFGLDGRIGSVALGEPGTPRALTLVDDRPVVVESSQARPVDPTTLALGAEWPISLGPGPIVAADHSNGLVVARTPTRLAVVGPSTPARTIALPADPSPTAPVEHGGRIFLTQRSVDGITVVDPKRPDARRRITVPAPGDLAIFEHAGHLWYTRSGSVTEDGQVGVITPGLTARPIQVGTDAGPDGPGDGRREQADASWPDGTGDPGPAQAREDRGPSPVPDNADASCARNSRARHCLPDPDQLRPGAPPSPGAGACPRTWDPDLCLTERTGVPTGPPGPGEPAPPTEPAAPRITWTPPSPKIGDQVTLDITGGPPGARHWTIDGIDRHELTPVVTWRNADDHPVSVTVGDLTLHAAVPVSRQVMPAIEGYTVEAAIRELEGVGLTVTSNRREVPSIHPTGTAQGVRAKDAIIPPGTPIDESFAVDLDISDGTKPILAMDSVWGLICVLTADHDVYCLGGDPTFQLGAPDRDRFARVTLPADATDVAVGWSHACAVLTTGKVWCWGANNLGQLGHLGPASASQPVEADGLTGITQIDASAESTCARRSDSTVWCWGAALVEDGAVSVSEPFERLATLTPRQVPDVSGAAAVAVGDSHACAIVADGTVRCWGQNESGQLGVPSDSDMIGIDGSLPKLPAVTVPGDGGAPLRGVQEIVAGNAVSCARVGGRLWCWGWLDVYAGPGDPIDPVSGPVAIAGGDRLTNLSADSATVCGVRTDGAIWCNWMTTPNGDPGGLPPDPLRLPGPGGAMAVLAGANFTCGVLDDRSLHCAGYLPWSASPEPALTFTRIPVVAG